MKSSQLLERKKKLEDMSMHQFLKRLDPMNNAFTSLIEGGKSFAVEEINMQVISKALPVRIAT